MLDRIRRRLHIRPSRGVGATTPVADPYEGAQRLATQHLAIRRTLADLHTQPLATQRMAIRRTLAELRAQPARGVR